MKIKNKIEDFGEKIGGARKDFYAKGLSIEDISSFTDAEKLAFIKKKNIWALPSAKKMVEDGEDPFMVYWKRQVRKFCRVEPKIKTSDTKEKIETIFENYIKTITVIRDAAMSCNNDADIYEFYDFVKTKKESYYSFIPEWKDVVSIKLAFDYTRLQEYKRKVTSQNYPFGNEGKDIKKAKERKKAFVPPQLNHIQRDGLDYRKGRNIRENDWQEKFAFRGVEFGNWMSQNDRQASMNFGYEAFLDLANALHVSVKDITFGGSLALAFGARGCSRASAHYEPLREVINLTKMHGAGCTAHEWFHALDHKIAQHYGLVGKLASESLTEKMPESFRTLVKALKKDADGNKTDYYVGSKVFGGQFAKEAHGFWTSNCEMMARAFACYVKDSLGYKSDYLIAHADCYVFEFENQSACAIPQGEERELFNELFDTLISDLKKEGILHVPEKKINISPKFDKEKDENIDKDQYINIVCEKNGQYSFF